jgi:hypothetical protein
VEASGGLPPTKVASTRAESVAVFARAYSARQNHDARSLELISNTPNPSITTRANATLPTSRHVQ